jgi:polysaccharide pyruvyl transferase WcaK-like protein
MSAKNTVAYLGAFGVGNRGDDFLIEAFSKKRRPDAIVGFAPLSFLPDVPFIHLDAMATIKSMPARDLVVCGGNFVWSTEQLRTLLLIARKFKSSGGRVEFRSVHVDEDTIYLDYDGFQQLALLADVFTVRDQYSISVCAGFGIRVSFEPDPLGTYVASLGYELSSQKPVQRVGFNFHNFGPESLNWYFEFLGTLNHQAPSRLALTYVVQCRHRTHAPSNDVLIGEYLYSRFGGEVAVTAPDVGLGDLLGYYSKQDLFVSNRTHGIIIANSLGLPVIAAGIRDKKSLAIARDLSIALAHMNESPFAAAERCATMLRHVA